MEILEADVSHIDLVVPLFDSYRQFYKQSSDPEGARRFLLERMERRESVIYMAVENGAARGFVQLYPSFSSASMRRIWILNDLFVTPSGRKAGTGRALMERARQLALATGAKGLQLATALDNTTAQSLYKSLGYRQDCVFLHYFLEI